MNYLSDLHTHTIVSGHAYTTLMENIDFCSKKGIKILGTSDHGPTMPGSPHYWYFGNLKVVPRIINDVIILKGCEANILDVDGNIDIPNNAMKNLDYMIASFHEPVFKLITVLYLEVQELVAMLIVKRWLFFVKSMVQKLF